MPAAVVVGKGVGTLLPTVLSALDSSLAEWPWLGTWGDKEEFPGEAM